MGKALADSVKDLRFWLSLAVTLGGLFYFTGRLQADVDNLKKNQTELREDVKTVQDDVKILLRRLD